LFGVGCSPREGPEKRDTRREWSTVGFSRRIGERGGWMKKIVNERKLGVFVPQCSEKQRGTGEKNGGREGMDVQQLRIYKWIRGRA